MFAVDKKRKRKSSDSSAAQTPLDNTCSFCQQVPAALAVQVPVLHRKKRAATPYCVACYYSTSAVRQDPEKYVSVLDEQLLDEQLPPLQQLFSEVYIELHKELSEETARAFQKQKKDPLAMLHRAAPKRKPPPPISQKKKAGNAADGGFLRSVPLPERLLRTQQQQARLQQEQIARMNRIAKEGDISSVYQRRKSSRKSIWNLAMDPNAAKAIAEGAGNLEASLEEHVTPCSCGSKDVRNFGNITSRNEGATKGEILGSGSSNDVVTRYQCNTCGKTWNEEE